MATPATVNPLDRQQARRTSGVPTLGALVGPIGLAVRAWRAWATDTRRPCVIASVNDPGLALGSWLRVLFAASPPHDRACEWLASMTGRPVETVATDVGRMTRFDLSQLARSLPIDTRRPGATAALLVLADAVSGTRTDHTRFVRVVGGEAGLSDAITRVVQAVTELYPSALWPALLIVPPTDAGKEWSQTTARVLERIADAEPGVSVALALPSDEYTRLAASRPEGRVAALMREGFVELRGVTGNQLEQQFQKAGVAPPSPAVLSRLAETGLAEDVAGAFVAASRAVHNPTPTELASDFRSVHEEFLFELLESMPRTAGLFRPNQPLGFRHGHLPAEADLWADSLKLVIEVDGAHYHLTAEQYRRDRRKDWLYQRHGYAVLRFLAEDVVGDIEHVLDTILAAVEFRRPATHTTGAL